MDIMTPELIDLARERGSAFVAVYTPNDSGIFEYAWDSTDARWEEILRHIGSISQRIDYVGVVTEGVTIDNKTYEMREHLTVTVVHRGGYTVYRVPLKPFNALVDTDPVISWDSTIDELEFDFPALWSVLGW